MIEKKMSEVEKNHLLHCNPLEYQFKLLDKDEHLILHAQQM